MVSVNNVCVQFSGNDLFKGISFVVNEKDRIGLVGKNGVGKSTLMKIMAGQQVPESGGITIPEGKSVGYLSQDIHINSDKSILEETLSVLQDVNAIQEEIDSVTKELESRTDYESNAYIDLITKLTDAHETLNNSGGDKLEGEAEKILKGLGFPQSDFTRPVSEFSGGWQMRVELAKLLLQMPYLLLLDEPTNHLDIESIMWLENFFQSYPGAIMMVSHDRMFLDNVTNRTIEIVFGKIHDYKVSYSKYFQLREERLEQQRATFENQQKMIASKEKFIERFKAKNSKAKQAQSMLKQLDKIERVDFDELDTSTIQFRFPQAPRSGDLVIGGDNVTKAYGDSVILEDLDFKIVRGDRIAFVGQNGQGKSTLVKLINKEVEFNGDITIGHNVEIGYYAQIQDKTLDENRTVLETIEDVATGDWSKNHKIRGLLGAFLFGKEDIEKKVKVLSGGERARLAIAKLLLKPYNLLILDEPTNHLDIASKEVLKNALRLFDGTLILVSHDREFLQGLTDRTFEFKNKKIKEHIGEISEFLNHHELQTFRQFELSGKKDEKKNKKNNSSQKTEFLDKKSAEKLLKKLNSGIAKSEKEISRLEAKIEEFEASLKDSSSYQKVINDKDAYSAYEQNKQDLEQEMEHWESLSTELDTIN